MPRVYDTSHGAAARLAPVPQLAQTRPASRLTARLIEQAISSGGAHSIDTTAVDSSGIYEGQSAVISVNREVSTVSSLP